VQRGLLRSCGVAVPFILTHGHGTWWLAWRLAAAPRSTAYDHSLDARLRGVGGCELKRLQLANTTSASYGRQADPQAPLFAAYGTSCKSDCQRYSDGGE
jgi:hypothetical protein